MKKLLSLALGLCFGTLAGLGASSQTVPQYQLVSSNATVLFATNTANLILDLTAVVPASTNSGNWQAIGTNSANLAPSGGTATMPFAAIGTNHVGQLITTNGPVFNVLAYGAKVDGTSDSSSAFQAAINQAASVGGGVVYAPHVSGKPYLANFVITNSSISVAGDGGSYDRLVIHTNEGTFLGPFDPAKPVVTIGQDSGLTLNVQIRDIAFNGSSNGDNAILIGGGSQRCEIYKCTISEFIRGVIILGGTNFSTGWNYVSGSTIILPDNRNTNTCGVLVLAPLGGTNYNTPNFIRGCLFDYSGADLGHPITIDGSDVYASDTWIQTHDLQGVILHETAGTNWAILPGSMHCSNVKIDSNFSTDRLLTITYANSGTNDLLGTSLDGANMDGYWVDVNNRTVTNQAAPVLQFYTTLSSPVVQGNGLLFSHDANNMGASSSGRMFWDGHQFAQNFYPSNATDTSTAWTLSFDNVLMAQLGGRTNAFFFRPGNGELFIQKDGNAYLELGDIANTKTSIIQGDTTDGDLLARSFRDFRIVVNNFTTDMARFYAGGGIGLGNAPSDPGTNKIRLAGTTQIQDLNGVTMASFAADGLQNFTIPTNQLWQINDHAGNVLALFQDTNIAPIIFRPASGTFYIEHSTQPKLALTDITGNKPSYFFGDPVNGPVHLRGFTDVSIEVNDGGASAATFYANGGEFFGPLPSNPGAYNYKFNGNIEATTNVDAATYSIGGAALISTGSGNVNLTGHLVEGTVDIATLTAGHAVITNGMTVNTNTLYVTNNAVGIGTVAPTHWLHIVTATNDAVAIDSTGTDSNSMLHILNTGVQGPFFDFHAASDRYGFGISSLGAFDIRHSAVGTDPVNGTNVLTLDSASVLTTLTADLTTANVTTANVGTLHGTNAATFDTNVTSSGIVTGNYGLVPGSFTTANLWAISSPATGKILYCTDCLTPDGTGSPVIYTGSKWALMGTWYPVIATTTNIDYCRSWSAHAPSRYASGILETWNDSSGNIYDMPNNSVSGAGAALTGGASSFTNSSGNMSIMTGTSATSGYLGCQPLYRYTTFKPQNATFGYMRVDGYLTSLCNGSTISYFLAIGFAPSAGFTSIPSTYTGFIYDPGNKLGTNQGNANIYQMIAQNAGTYTTANGVTTPSTTATAPDTWEIITDGTAGTATMYTNGVLATTISYGASYATNTAWIPDIVIGVNSSSNSVSGVFNVTRYHAHIRNKAAYSVNGINTIP